MKGLRDEIEKDELQIISDGFNTNNVHSEYNKRSYYPKAIHQKNRYL